ncbi:hypothetical protein ES703_52351 [subsurface metagenome]
MLAPPSFKARARLAVSVVMCKHAEMRIFFSGFSAANLSLISFTTGISREAHSIRCLPALAREGSLMS